ncbi:MAG: polynucleotide adenylyltransferase PcnB [Spirochaetota bacterium]
MLVRYTKDEKGRAKRQAEIYTPKEHAIDRSAIDQDAVKIVRRLQGSGHHAYIVGGAVRDLLIGNTPKDFDVSTDAQPNRIRRLFRNSRVIGRRFRLVHIFFGPKIIEVSTFRSETSAGFQNEYGDIEEDVFRRDFTLNALYYNPTDGRIIDYVGGVKDIRARRLRPVIPVNRIFEEDPVRMIRAIKYQVSTGFTMVGKLRRQLKRSADLLADTPPSRMTEEVFKILLSGNAAGIVETCMSYRLFGHMIPGIASIAEGDAEFRSAFLSRLADLDAEVREANEDRRSRAIAYLTGDYLFERSDSGRQDRISFPDAFAELKRIIRPLVPANKDVEMGLVYLIRHRKNYRKTGRFETAPPSERQRQEDEPWRGDRESDGEGEPKKKRRRSRRPRSRSKPRQRDE